MPPYIYIVVRGVEYEGEDILAVFTTLEAAEEYKVEESDWRGIYKNIYKHPLLGDTSDYQI